MNHEPAPTTEPQFELVPPPTPVARPRARRTDDPFLLPPGNVQVSFSGGRTSALMLHGLIERNGVDAMRSDRVKVVFANTGLEHEATLQFVAECERRWGVPVHWVEFTAGANGVGYRETSVATASRRGEPMEKLVEWKRWYLPNIVESFCSVELKIRTAKRFLMDRGWRSWTTMVGIRADESHRCRETRRERSLPRYPLVGAGICKRDVGAFWDDQPFRLGLPVVNGSVPLGNCVDCFKKSEAFLAGRIRDGGDGVEDMDRIEARAAEVRGDDARFSKRFSRAEMRRFIETQPDAFDWLRRTGSLCQADDGECTDG